MKTTFSYFAGMFENPAKYQSKNKIICKIYFIKDGSGGIWIIRISYNLLKGLKGTVSVISNGPCISNRVACPILNENRWTSIWWTKCENFFLTNIETTIKNNWIFEIRSRIACYFITGHWKLRLQSFLTWIQFVFLLVYCMLTVK